MERLLIVCLYNQTSKLPIYLFIFQRPSRHIDFFAGLNAHFTLSKFGKPVLILGGYRHNMQNPKNVNQQTTRWRCCKWSSFHCRATIITIETQIVKVVNRHNHPAEDFGHHNVAKTENTCATQSESFHHTGF